MCVGANTLQYVQERSESDENTLVEGPQDNSGRFLCTRFVTSLAQILYVCFEHGNRQRNSEATSSKEAMLKSRHDGFGVEVCTNLLNAHGRIAASTSLALSRMTNACVAILRVDKASLLRRRSIVISWGNARYLFCRENTLPNDPSPRRRP